MKIIHHFFFKITGQVERQEFREAGIKLPAGARIPGGGIGIGLDMAESDPKWAEAARLSRRYKAIESVYTRFTEAECDSAKYLGIVAASHRGFPEPASGKGYLAATFDLSNFCARCGVGRRQVRPFRMKAGPTLHNSLMQLNWILASILPLRLSGREFSNPWGSDAARSGSTPPERSWTRWYNWISPRASI